MMTMESELSTTVRATWDFRYKTSEVFGAAKKQAAYHTERYDSWTKDAVTAEKALKAKGFEYRKEQYTGRADMVIVGDPQLVNRLTDCQRMMEEHRVNKELFEVWARALGGRAKKEPDSELVLKIDDVVFFGL